MPSIASTLPLLFKAHVLGTASARVALDAQRSSPRLCAAAMKSIRNAEMNIARQVSRDTLCSQRLQAKTLKLADLRCRLNKDTTPVARAIAGERVLSKIGNVQEEGSAGAALMAQQCHPEQVLLRRRDVLATAFWAGELNQRALFSQQVKQLAGLERCESHDSAPMEETVRSIINHLQRACPHASTYNPQTTILARFTQDVLAAQARAAGRPTPGLSPPA